MIFLKKTNSRLIHWRLKLEEFYYEIAYKRDKSNTNAEALSRIKIHIKELSKLEQYLEEFNEQLSLARQERQQNDVENESLARNLSEDLYMGDIIEEPQTKERRTSKNTEGTTSVTEEPRISTDTEKICSDATEAGDDDTI